MPGADRSKKIEQLGRKQTYDKETDWLNDVRMCRDDVSKSLNPDVGLAFSGGGVRSATFNLGVLQALASQAVLDKVGYVSSVSGGSYINSWLAAWISKDGFKRVNRALADHNDKTQKNPEDRYNAQRPIAHLRHYSSYLTPHKGILSSDVWTAVAAYLLRLAPNLLFVLSVASAVIVAPYILRNAYDMTFIAAPQLAVAMCAAGIALFVIKDLAGLFGKAGWFGYKPDQSTESRKAATRHARITFAAMLLLGPILAITGLDASIESYVPRLWIFSSLFLLALVSAALFGHSVGLTRNNGGKSNGIRIVLTLIVSALVGAAAFALAAAVFTLFYRVPNLDSHLPTGVALAIVFGPALLLLAYVAMASVGVAMLPYESGSQEWLNRIWGDTAILTLNWTIIAAISLLWPQLLKKFHELFSVVGWPVLGSWMLTTVASILSAFSSKTSGPPTADATPTPWRIRTKMGRNQYPLESFLARISPYLFGAGLLIGISSLVSLTTKLSTWWHVELFLFLVCFLFALGSRLDVNRLSLHNFYRFRLIECYLAASCGPGAEAVRMGHLSPELAPEQKPAEWKSFEGPFPIINCTLNVTKEDSLDLQKRRARNFIFTPTACGFTRFENHPAMIASLDCASDTPTPLSLAEHKPEELAPANSNFPSAERKRSWRIKGGIRIFRFVFRATANFSLAKRKPEDSARPVAAPPAPSVKKGISLGAAMAISGAAQSPNQGSHTSPAVAALLTLTNIRLGWWLGNPGNEKTCAKEGPTNGLWPMLDELQAQATDKNEYVYLSDGGHFENLGLYELIRRRCSLIILCDADRDPNYKFDDLVNAIELCQVDFGATITIDTDPLQNTLKAGWCRSAFTVGAIEYAPENGESKTGTLIYLKSAVTRGNSIVVHSYDRQSRHFPHEPTTNQWFDETQFEAYRLLGLETANSALEALKRFANKKKKNENKENLNNEQGSGTAGEWVFIPPLWWNAAQAKCDWGAHAERTLHLLWPELVTAMRVDKNVA